MKPPGQSGGTGSLHSAPAEAAAGYASRAAPRSTHCRSPAGGDQGMGDSEQRGGSRNGHTWAQDEAAQRPSQPDCACCSGRSRESRRTPRLRTGPIRGSAAHPSSADGGLVPEPARRAAEPKAGPVEERAPHRPAPFQTRPASRPRPREELPGDPDPQGRSSVAARWEGAPAGGLLTPAPGAAAAAGRGGPPPSGPRPEAEAGGERSAQHGGARRGPGGGRGALPPAERRGRGAAAGRDRVAVHGLLPPRRDAAAADQDPLLQGRHRRLLRLQQLRVDQLGDPLSRPHPGSRGALRPRGEEAAAFTTLEGILDRAIAGLEQDQPDRRKTDPEVAGKIDGFISKLKGLKEVESAFTFILDDPSGNSFVENPHAPQKDDALEVTHYRRTAQQAALLGIEAEGLEEDSADAVEDLRNEVLQFRTSCPECNAPASTNMKLVQIPHFKEVIIMATNCDACGHRTNEVKSGGAIEPLGTKITLHMTGPADMIRDVLKSETCKVQIPELEFELGMGALGGKFTTLEGLLKDIQGLVEKNPFALGDGSCPDKAEKLRAFGRKLQQIVEGQMKAHLVLDDPAGNSYLQNVYAPEDDPELRVEQYERLFEQNEELGLNDMKTEGYEADTSSHQ